MTLRLAGSTSGYTEIDAPAVAGSNTLVLPTGNGSADQVLGGNGAGALSWVDRGRMVLETAKATTSGTSIDFTGIPSWVKRVTVMLNGVSTNGTSAVRIQLGAGLVQTTGYVTAFTIQAAVGGSTTGFDLGGFTTNTDARYGQIQFTLMGSNIWAGLGAFSQGSASNVISGGVTLSGTLDRVRVTSVNGTDTFDAGSINILYEG
jgi:hypothetical protein